MHSGGEMVPSTKSRFNGGIGLRFYDEQINDRTFALLVSYSFPHICSHMFSYVLYMRHICHTCSTICVFTCVAMTGGVKKVPWPILHSNGMAQLSLGSK